jgi:hypothetical protein
MSEPESKTPRSEAPTQKERGVAVVSKKAQSSAHGVESARRVFDTAAYPVFGTAPYLTIQGGHHGVVNTTATVRVSSRVLLSLSFPIHFLAGSTPNLTFEVRRYNRYTRETVSITRHQLLIVQRNAPIASHESLTYSVCLIDRRAPPGSYTYTLLLFNNQLPLLPPTPESIVVTVQTMSFLAIPNNYALFARQRTPVANASPPRFVLSIFRNPPRTIRKTVELFSHPVVHDALSDVSSTSTSSGSSGGSSKEASAPSRGGDLRTESDAKRDSVPEASRDEREDKPSRDEREDKPSREKRVDDDAKRRKKDDGKSDRSVENKPETESKMPLEASERLVAVPYPVSIIATLSFAVTLPAAATGSAILNYQFVRSHRPFGRQYPIGNVLPALRLRSTGTTVTTHQTIQVSATDLLNVNERTTYGIVLQNVSDDPSYVFHVAWYSLVIGDVGGIGPQPNLYVTSSLPDVYLDQVAAYIPHPSILRPAMPLVSTSALALAFSAAYITASFDVQSENRFLRLTYDLRRDGRSIVNGPQQLTDLDLGVVPSAPMRTVLTVSAYDKTVAPGTHDYSFVVRSFDTTHGAPQVAVRTYQQTVALLEIAPVLVS